MARLSGERAGGDVPRILDIHAHVGDLVSPSGGGLVSRSGVKSHDLIVGDSMIEEFLSFLREIGDYGAWRAAVRYRHVPGWITKHFSKLIDHWMIVSEQARSRTATHDNFVKVMQGHGVTHSCCLPVAPNVSGEVVREAIDKSGDNIGIPFEGVDFNMSEEQIFDYLMARIKSGDQIYGLKIHPILQQVSLTGDKVRAAMGAWKNAEGRPVIVHTGVCKYYLEDDGAESPELGDVRDVINFVREYANKHVPIILAHAGLDRRRQLVSAVRNYPMARVDTTFQPPKGIEFLVKQLGVERVLLGTDWPYGSVNVAIRNVESASGKRSSEMDKILYGNGAALLGI